MQGENGGLELWKRVFYHWNCLSIMVIKSRPTWVSLIIIVKFLMDGTHLYCPNLGSVNFQPPCKAQKWQIAVPNPNAEPRDYKVSSVLVPKHEREASSRVTLWFYKQLLMMDHSSALKVCSQPELPDCISYNSFTFCWSLHLSGMLLTQSLCPCCSLHL